MKGDSRRILRVVTVELVTKGLQKLAKLEPEHGTNDPVGKPFPYSFCLAINHLVTFLKLATKV